MSSWLITGANGQVGRSLLALASEYGVEAHGVSHAELDIVDAEAVRRALDKYEPDVLANCAAFTRVDDCEEDFHEAERNNTAGPEVLASVCGHEVLLLQLSTEYVFDGSGNRPIKEDAPPRPLSMYGRTKHGAEEAIKAAGGTHLIARTQWLYGDGANAVRTILALARTRPELAFVDDQLGRPTSTDALAGALFQAVGAGARGLLHLACEGVASWYDLAVDVVEEGARRHLNPRVPVRAIPSSEMPRPAARPAYGVLGLDRARGLGIVLPHWRDALRAYLDKQEREDV